MTKPQSLNLRLIKTDEVSKIVYIKHLGSEPYNEVKFECGKKLIVSYSLSYWHSIFHNFYRINKGVLINPNKIVSTFETAEVVLIDNSKFTFSRRRYKSFTWAKPH